MGKLSLIVIAIVIVFLTGFGSAIRVELQASDNWVFHLSNIDCCVPSFFYDEFPDSRVVIYSPIKSELAKCPVPLAAVNSTGKTFISLNKSAGECNVNMLVRVEVVDQWSEFLGTVKGVLIDWNIKANRADFRVLAPTQKKYPISLRLTKPEADCIIDLVPIVQHIHFSPGHQLQAIRYVFTAICLILVVALLLLALKKSADWGFPELYQHKFPAHHEPEPDTNHIARQE